MRKILIILGLVVLTMIFLTRIPSKATAAPIVMRLAETHPQDYPTTKGDYEFEDLLKRGPMVGSSSRFFIVSSWVRRSQSLSRSNWEPST